MNNFIVIPLKYNQKINQGVLTLLKLKLINSSSQCPNFHIKVCVKTELKTKQNLYVCVSTYIFLIFISSFD